MEVIASEFARMAGVSAMAVSKRIASGTLIRNSAKKLDTDNPVNRAYLDRMQAKMKERIRMRAIESAAGVPDVAVPGSSASVPPRIPAGTAPASAAYGNAFPAGISAGEMLRLPLGQLIRQFSTVENIEKYSKILRDLSAADERAQKTQERRLVQIPKDFVVQRLFGFVEQLMNRLLDIPEAVSDQVIAIALAGEADARKNVQSLLNDNISRCIAGAKEKIIGELDALRGKYDSERAAEMKLEDALAAVQDE